MASEKEMGNTSTAKEPHSKENGKMMKRLKAS